MERIRDQVETVFAAAAFAERNEPEEALLLLKGAKAATVQARPGQKKARPKPAARAE